MHIHVSMYVCFCIQISILTIDTDLMPLVFLSLVFYPHMNVFRYLLLYIHVSIFCNRVRFTVSFVISFKTKQNKKKKNIFSSVPVMVLIMMVQILIL